MLPTVIFPKVTKYKSYSTTVLNVQRSQMNYRCFSFSHKCSIVKVVQECCLHTGAELPDEVNFFETITTFFYLSFFCNLSITLQ